MSNSALTDFDGFRTIRTFEILIFVSVFAVTQFLVHKCSETLDVVETGRKPFAFHAWSVSPIHRYFVPFFRALARPKIVQDCRTVGRLLLIVGADAKLFYEASSLKNSKNVDRRLRASRHKSLVTFARKRNFKT